MAVYPENFAKNGLLTKKVDAYLQFCCLSRDLHEILYHTWYDNYFRAILIIRSEHALPFMTKSEYRFHYFQKRGLIIMENVIRPILEFTVILPGILLAYLPMRSYLKQSFSKMLLWLIPLLTGISILEGICCFRFNMPTILLLFPTAMLLMLMYHKTLQISVWKSGSIFLAVCAVFICVNSLTRAVNALLTIHQNLSEMPIWFCTKAGLFYNLICWIFVLLVCYPASHSVRSMIESDNFAQTWYVFWIIPILFIWLNIFMIPKYRQTLYTGRILQGYIVISIVLLCVLLILYAMFLFMAINLNRNAKLQQENHILSLQQERYDNLCNAIEETRRARHDMRHHFLQLSSLVKTGDLEKIQDYLNHVSNKIPNMNMHFCDNHAVDSIISYYCSLAKRNQIPFYAQIDLPEHIGSDEMDICLILSNLLENALEGSLRVTPSRRDIRIYVYQHSPYMLLIYAENYYEGEIKEKNGVFQSSKRAGAGIGIQSIRHIVDKSGGVSTFTYENGIFAAKIMLKITQETYKETYI